MSSKSSGDEKRALKRSDKLGRLSDSAFTALGQAKGHPQSILKQIPEQLDTADKHALATSFLAVHAIDGSFPNNDLQAESKYKTC